MCQGSKNGFPEFIQSNSCRTSIDFFRGLLEGSLPVLFRTKIDKKGLRSRAFLNRLELSSRFDDRSKILGSRMRKFSKPLYRSFRIFLDVWTNLLIVTSKLRFSGSPNPSNESRYCSGWFLNNFENEKSKNPFDLINLGSNSSIPFGFGSSFMTFF